MAKGVFALYGGKGKIGNMVAYKNPNSNNADTTVVRAYTANVKNPKTRKQADQRMRMLPAQNFYRAFRTLLDHSWQGVKYGGRSYAKFMKLALADKTLEIPYQEKGDSNFIPGPYPIASGSLAPISVSHPSDVDGTFVTDLLITPASVGQNATIGDFSTAIIANNNDFENGDFITFVAVSNAGDIFSPWFYRIKLDVTSTTLLDSLPFELINNSDDNITYLRIEHGTLYFIGGAVIHSREPQQGSTTWLRSNAKMSLAPGAISAYRTAEAEAKAIESYQSRAGETNSHWYLNGGTE